MDCYLSYRVSPEQTCELELHLIVSVTSMPSYPTLITPSLAQHLRCVLTSPHQSIPAHYFILS